MNPNELRALVKECVLEVLQESLLEGFDPLSQGPNMVDPSGETNPYPIWNSKMRKLEEDEVAENANYQKMIDINNEKTLKLYHHLYKQTGEFEHGNSGNMLAKFGFTFGTEDEPMSYYKKLPTFSLQVMFLPSNKFLVTKHLDGKQMGSFSVLNNEAELFDWLQDYSNISENEHGRYAQEAGAGQFDPRTFGKL